MAKSIETASGHKSVSVALVCHSYPPVVGGSEIEAQRVCVALQKRGHRVQVLCAGGPPMPNHHEWIDPMGVPVRLLGGNWPDAWRGYAYALGVAWILFRDRKQYDIVYFLMSGLQIATGVPVARGLRKRIIMKFSGSSLIRQMTRSRLGRLELTLLRRWADRIMLLNDGMVEEALEVALNPDKLMWMPNPVDTGEFRPIGEEQRIAIRERLRVPAAASVILFVGRLAPEKELPSLIQAFARVIRTHPDAILAIVGDGPSRADLERHVSELTLSRNVTFTGMVAGSDVREWMQASDVFALVSSLEGLPCSLIEAMSVGLSAVVTDIPANTQLIEHGVQGLVAPLKDDVALAAELTQLIDDPALRRQMGDQGRSRVLAKYSTTAVVAAYENLFAELMAGPPKPSHHVQ